MVTHVHCPQGQGPQDTVPHGVNRQCSSPSLLGGLSTEEGLPSSLWSPLQITVLGGRLEMGPVEGSL